MVITANAAHYRDAITAAKESKEPGKCDRREGKKTRRDGRSRGRRNRNAEKSTEQTGRPGDQADPGAKLVKRQFGPINLAQATIMKFIFTLGTLTSQFAEGAKTDKVIDPVERLHIPAPASTRGTESGHNANGVDHGEEGHHL